jgi:hypothetical protein
LQQRSCHLWAGRCWGPFGGRDGRSVSGDTKFCTGPLLPRNHPRTDRSIGDNPLTLGGTVYKHGVGVSANSELAYSLKPDYTRFVAVIGVDDAMRKYRQGTVVFEIQIDDRPVFSTFVMRPGNYTYVLCRLADSPARPNNSFAGPQRGRRHHLRSWRLGRRGVRKGEELK